MDVLTDCKKDMLRHGIDEAFYRVERYSENLTENGAMNFLHKIISPISKLFVGSGVHHEYVVFRSLRFYVCVEFVNDHRVKVRISPSFDYIIMERKKSELVKDC